MSDKNIYQRINAVMQDVKYLKKDASIQGYKAVTHDALVGEARQSIVNHGLVLAVSQLHGQFCEPEEGKKMRLYIGSYEVSLINIDMPEEKVSVTMEAHALDNGDKAPGKCCTYATKTALLKLLWLETGESDESRAELRNTLSEDAQNEIAALIDGDANLWQSLCNAYKITHLEQLRDKKVEEVKKRIATYKERQSGNN